jgi:hypothetical protein
MTVLQPHGEQDDDSGSYGEQSGETTDGFANGGYWVRTRTGSLYRFASASDAPLVVASGLSFHYCDDAPHVMRVGGYGAFLVCDGESPLRVQFRAL